jgi:threonyl-tRNA synthetase
MLLIGKRDMDVDAVSIRVHGKGNLGAKPRSEAIAEILQTIRGRHP